MAKLAEEVQAFIVHAHARFRKPSLIIKDVKAEFSVDVSREQVLFYNPERGGEGKRLAKKWKKIFDAAREAYIKAEVEIGIAHQSYRLELYQRAADYYENLGNYVLAAEMAERAAKEKGGAYTNRRELTGHGGQPLIPSNIESQIEKVYAEGPAAK
jgi:hypothetical protein